MYEKMEILKETTAFAAPVTKMILDVYLRPKIEEFFRTNKRKTNLEQHVIFNGFEEYLSSSYLKFSFINTLVFNNNQKLLDTLYIPLTVRSSENQSISFKIDKFHDDFIPFYQRILITDTAGMGKSTLVKKIFKLVIEEEKGVPFLIELRRLSIDKGIIEEMLEQLKPINTVFDEELLLDLVKQGGFIFLLDGFDEISAENRSWVFGQIQSFISKSGNNYFVITSRPEGALAAFGDFMEFKVKPLTKEEAFELIRKYNNYGQLSELLIKKLQETRNESVTEFLTNPLLVSLLFTAFEHKQNIPLKKHTFYRQVYDAFFETHDLTKGDSFERNKLSGLDIDEFHRILRYIGYICLIKGRIEFLKDELLPIIKEAKQFTTLNFKESDFLSDLVKTVPLFTIDGVYYKWAHKSLQEYFAAQFIYNDCKDKQKDILIKLSTHNGIETFLNVLDLYHSIDPKTFKQTVIYHFLQEFETYVSTSYTYVEDKDLRKERQLLTFGHDYIIVYFNHDLQHEEAINKLFKLVREVTGKGGRISHRAKVEEKIFGKLKVVVSEKPTYKLLLLLHNLKYDFFIKKVPSPCVERIGFTLPQEAPILLTESESSILNTTENFAEVNKLIQTYPHPDPYFSIDEKKLGPALTTMRVHSHTRFRTSC